MREIEESPLIAAAGERWEAATEAEFLRAIGDGTLPDAAFGRWLVQDYLFARGLTCFQCVAAARMPRGPQSLLIRGLSAMDAEMTWFERHLADRRMDLSADPHPVCRRYVDFLIAAAYSLPWEVLLAILYGVEVSYLAGWSRLERKGPYAEFIERWTNESFVEYVRGLCEEAHAHRHPEQQGYFDETLRHERDFWRMTWEG